MSSWDWSFGDGASSTQANPSHTYTAAGIYSVVLTATGGGSFDTASRINYVTAAVPAAADFIASPTTVCAPLDKIQFTDTSAGFPAAWSWDFGDGYYSAEQNPTHAYKWPGTYSVTLKIRGGCGSSTTTKTNVIQVNPPCGYQALALSDLSVLSFLAGDYTRTQVEDDVWEVMYEVLSGSGTSAYSALDHRWTFNVPPGVANTFRVRTYRNAPFETESFRFQYSTDNVNFTTLVNSVPVGYGRSSVPMPANLSGLVYVRVIDTNRAPGTQAIDSIYVDSMSIESTQVVPPRRVGTVSNAVFSSKTQMRWDPAASATSYDIMRGDLAGLRLSASVGDASCAKAANPGTTWSDPLVPAAGGGFYYLIRGEAPGMEAGTYDSAGGPPQGAEARDSEVGTAGGTVCPKM